ncbi:hypothetical protein BSZ35_03140 [Salinibacter sp. 10B]|uniref:lysylphosphatidylglycerol synthase domain-containing protein n=1 Tax=Salinibacter sp. 10B TaxID=1923971 RepID=UPI000CF4BFB5|nr:lysylphosphatidylglycerol synthase domain-containing protein [Salinibacter sp. 10B]PQJ33730.1 hypothetical protein BSZ35_03140 [Salinibacter sp. 10B]
MPRWLRILLKSSLTLGGMTALVMAVDPAVLLDSLHQARGFWIAAAVLLLPLNLFLDGWVWTRLLKTLDGSFPSRTIAKAVMSGLALGFWTPARLGEYAGRAFAFPDADQWAISLTVFVQRMVDMAIGVIVGLATVIGAIGLGLLPSSLSWLAAAGIGLGTGGGLLAVLLNPAWGHRWAQGLLPDSRLTERTILLERLTPRQGLAVGLGSLVRYLVFTGQFVCLGLALQPSASVGALAIAVSLTFYAKYLLPSLTLLDLGIREGAAVFFFSLVGLGTASGLNAALLLFAINVLVPALLGLPFVARLPLPSASDDAITRRCSVLPESG